MITKQVIDEIRSRADIVEVIASYIPVTKKGNNYLAVCPFHADKNPSLTISKAKQIYRCFSCGHSGNVFGFVADYEHVTYQESIKKVAKFVNFDDPSLHEKKIVRTNEHLYNALNDACSYYNLVTKSKGGIVSKEYFDSRNIDETMRDYFKLGYSPSDSNITINMLNSKGHNIMTLDKIGITTRDKNEIVDRFNGRVLFPIFDINGSCIGFSGRKIDNSDVAKYVNSPTSEIFNKSATLYNLNNAKIESRSAGYCYIVEGFMDVFALYKAGIKSSVAIMGTAFTTQHAAILRKLGVELRIMLDGDAPGRKAVVSMCQTLDEEKIPYKVVDYKNILLDPDEILNTLGKEELLKLSNQLISGNDYLINYYKKEFDLSSIEGKKNFLAILAPRCYLFETKLEQEEYASILAKVTSTSLKSVGEFARKFKDKNSQVSDVDISLININKIKMNRLQKSEREIIYHILTCNDAIKDYLDVPNATFDNDIYGMIFNYILDFYETYKYISVSELCDELNLSNTKKEIVDEIISISTDEFHPPYDKELILDAIKYINLEIKKIEIDRLKEKIKLENDVLKKAELLKELSLKSK